MGMKKTNIDKTMFDQTSVGITMLNEITDEQLKALRKEGENILAIECNSEVSIDDVPLENCGNGMRMPLLVTFKDTCESTCQLETMQKANIEKTKFDQTTL